MTCLSSTFAAGWSLTTSALGMGCGQSSCGTPASQIAKDAAMRTDLKGQRFGMCVALEPTHIVLSSGRRVSAWTMKCDCGREFVRSTANAARDRSCGCARDALASKALTIHGAQRSTGRDPRYARWSNIKQRCFSTTCPAYPYYGGRGIGMADRWRFGEHGKSGFECFIEDIGPCPGPGYSLDRWPDNDGDYAPGNVRWATAKEQRHNQRRSSPTGSVKP